MITHSHVTEMNIEGIDFQVEIKYHIDINKHSFGTNAELGYQIESIEIIDFLDCSLSEKVVCELAIAVDRDKYNKDSVTNRALELLYK